MDDDRTKESATNAAPRWILVNCRRHVHVSAVVTGARRSDRVRGLDGVRGLAALFVVVNHIFLRAGSGFAVDRAPWWAAGFIYGRFAVIVFIALSGFSLGLPAARAGWRLGSVAAFARRRAWRILPPYWAALGFSLAMTWYVVAQPHRPVPNARSVLAYGTLLQDFAPNDSPNRAFWSIAVEAQLYVLLPLLLCVARRVGALVMVAVVLVAVVGVETLGDQLRWLGETLLNVTPDLAVLFAVGVLTSGIVVAGERTRSRPWAWYALGASAPVVVMIIVQGATWVDAHLFWVDLTWSPAIGCFLAALATSQPRPVLRLLESRRMRSLGSCSYSLYLTHEPIVIAVSYGLVRGRVAPGTITFLVLTVILLPATVGFARLFAAVFELPFQRHRGLAPLRNAMAARLTAWRSGTRVRPSAQPARTSERARNATTRSIIHARRSAP